MTIEELSQYRFIKREITNIEKEIYSLHRNIKSPSLDSVGGSTNVSNPTEETVFRLLEMEERLNEKRRELLDQVRKIEQWLDTVDDSKVRDAVRMKFMCFKQDDKPYTWKEVTEHVYGKHYSEKVAIKAVTRYLEKAQISA